MLFPAEQAFVGRDEKRAPLKMPAWEAMLFSASFRPMCDVFFENVYFSRLFQPFLFISGYLKMATNRLLKRKFWNA